MIRTGISTASFFGKIFTEDTIEYIAKMGTNMCEIFLDTFSEYEPEFIDILLERTKKYGLNVNSMHAMSTQFEPQLFSQNPRQSQDAIKMISKVFDAGQRLGASVYVFHGLPAFQRTNKLVNDYKRMAEIISPVADIAAEYGIKFAWENVNWCAYKHPCFARKIQNYITSDNLYFTMDVKQALMSGYSVEEYLDDMQDRVANVHVCDYIKCPDGSIKTCLPGKGEMDFPWLAKRLKEQGYSGSVIFEVYSSNYKNYSEMAASYKYIKDLFSR